MEEVFAGEELRDRLIIAGIMEIEAHGLTDFSLRRVASACGASCAAPYKHFKNKDALILEILRFINRQWDLLEQQITDIYRADTRQLVCELCMANIRFRVANPHFRAVLNQNGPALSAEHQREMERSMETICRLTGSLCGENAAAAQYTLRSLVYGAAALIGNGVYENTPQTMQMVEQTIGKTVRAF